PGRAANERRFGASRARWLRRHPRETDPGPRRFDRAGHRAAHGARPLRRASLTQARASFRGRSAPAPSRRSEFGAAPPRAGALLGAVFRLLRRVPNRLSLSASISGLLVEQGRNLG